jgi:hypothetical protein
MATGWLTWTCLLLAGSTGADEIVYMNQRGFQIPIRVQPDRQHEVKELILYMSSNKGQSWGISGRADPRKSKAFDFWAEQDGEYQFNVATIDKRDKQEPPDIYKVPAAMKVCVDTVKPVVRLASADRSGDEVTVAWEARDDRAEWTSFKVEYRAADNPGGQWTPLPVSPSERGNHRFRVNVPGDVHVRAVLRDLAGNEGADEKLAPGSAMRHDPAMRLTRNDDLPPPNHSVPPAPTPGGATPPVISTPSSQPVTQPVSRQPYDSAPITTANSSPTPPAPSRGQLPPLQIVNKRQVKLGFDVARFGPSGLSTVDIYVTQDEGATWVQSKDDPAVSLPVSPEVSNQAPVKGTVTVQLPADGKVYGFYLVVKSRAGLGKPPPMPGAVPHVRLECDTTQPSAELYRPDPDPARGTSLVLSWKAEDRNLSQNPISMEWSANATGPWEFIGGPELPNTGRYTWQVPPKIPPKVYLKLTVRDTAGNVAVAQTPEPVLIDLTVPEVGGVMVIGR